MAKTHQRTEQSCHERHTKVTLAGSFAGKPKAIVERRSQIFRMGRDIGWSPVRVRAPEQWVRGPSREVNVVRLRKSDVGIHDPENFHNFRLDLGRCELLDVESEISLKEYESSLRGGSEFTYCNCDKD